VKFQLPESMSHAYRIITELTNAINQKDERIAELKETVSKHIEICERHVSTRRYFEKRIAELEQIVLSVGHIGVDFGYGDYEIDQATIDKARQLTNKELTSCWPEVLLFGETE
jgi:hypothetical protein